MNAPYELTQRGNLLYFRAKDRTYRIAFDDCSTLLSKSLLFKVYSFAFAHSQEEQLLGQIADPRIKVTIVSIVQEFFQKNPNDVLFYTCDSTDGKHAFRKRLFDRWFIASHGTNVEKHDFDLPDYPTSFLLRANHPHKDEVVNEIVGSYNTLMAEK